MLVKKLVLFLQLLFASFMLTACVSKDETEWIVGNKILFGDYEQDANAENGKEAISWVVFKVEDDRVFLVSEKILEYKSFHFKNDSNITWDKSDICQWLNNDFFLAAFSDEEKAKIISAEIYTLNYGSTTAETTSHKVYLLSEDEYQNIIAEKVVLAGNSEKYADEEDVSENWFLREIGYNQSYISCVDEKGTINNMIAPMESVQGVRPVIQIHMD